MTKEAPLSVPFRERGYAIDIPALVVHERYAEHAIGLHRTSARGVENIAGAREIIPCHLCFPAPSKARGWSRAAGGRRPVVEDAMGPVTAAQFTASNTLTDADEAPASDTAADEDASGDDADTSEAE